MPAYLTHVAAAAVLGLLIAFPAAASPFFFGTGATDGGIVIATRPATSGGPFEIESADDFVLSAPTTLTCASFTGLVPTNSFPTDVVIEIYRVFPNDSDTSRTPNVATRVNSPSDNAFDSRDSASGGLSFQMTGLGDFTASNSVRPGGIALGTGGTGSVTGQEVSFDVFFLAISCGYQRQSRLSLRGHPSNVSYSPCREA